MAIVSSQSGPVSPGARDRPLCFGERPPSRSELTDPQIRPEDAPNPCEDRPRDDSLRPRRLADYIGQSELKQVLGIAVAATRGRGEALDHVLLLSLIHI